MNIQNLREYTEIYLITDILLLADVFQDFRKMCHKYYKLDPAHAYTLASFSWQAMLFYTKVNIELINDPDMYNLIERGIRGGISFIGHRHFLANNEEMDEEYDPEKPKKHILALDANSLYNYIMCKPLPISEFYFLTENDAEICLKNVHELNENAEFGYIFEVDLYYPTSLHDEHNDYPLAPEKREINFDDINYPYMQEVIESQNELNKYLKTTYKTERLCTTLENKEKYVLHYMNLQYYLKKGLLVTKLHKVLAFRQLDFMRGYMNLNIELKKKARNDADRKLIKLISNVIYGKTMQSMRNQVNFKLVNCPSDYRALVRKPAFKNVRLYSETLVGVELRKEKIFLNKPIQLGFTILDLSKLHMYQFLYDVIYKQFTSKRAQLLMTDTDSFYLGITSPNVDTELKLISNHLDLSNYDQNHWLYCDTNRLVQGKFKNETAKDNPREFIGLSSKLYCVRCADGDKIRAKGCKSSSQDLYLNFDLYKKTLFSNEVYYTPQTNIRSTNHQLETQCVMKLTLSSFNFKRHFCSCGVQSYAYGHYLLKQV